MQAGGQRYQKLGFRFGGNDEVMEYPMTTETLIKTQDPDQINDRRKADLLSSPV